MKKYIILIPIYNDKESLAKLIENINLEVKDLNSEINVVYGNEWNAGNLSYHLNSRPVWEGPVKREKLDQLKDYICLDNVCVGSK